MHSTDEDITLDEDWIDKQVDRFLAWEILVRALTLNTQEIPAEKLCDMIGMPKNYVYGILKKAKKKAEHAKRSI
jgi:23S rRNA A1618 N6-methylase RlmF